MRMIPHTAQQRSVEWCYTCDSTSLRIWWLLKQTNTSSQGQMWKPFVRLKRAQRTHLKTTITLAKKASASKRFFLLLKKPTSIQGFRFKHRKGLRGLGMITPLDIPPEVLPGNATTRLTLRYPSRASPQYSRLNAAVRDLSHTMIMLLQRIQTFHVSNTTSDGQCETSSISINRVIKVTVHYH